MLRSVYCEEVVYLQFFQTHEVDSAANQGFKQKTHLPQLHYCCAATTTKRRRNSKPHPQHRRTISPKNTRNSSIGMEFNLSQPNSETPMESRPQSNPILPNPRSPPQIQSLLRFIRPRNRHLRSYAGLQDALDSRYAYAESEIRAKP